jgi:DNA-binding response OmpR family regulator
MDCAGKVVPRRSLIEAVWGYERDIEENTLDAFVRLLRTKVDTRQPKLIHTVRGVGYMIRSEVDA